MLETKTKTNTNTISASSTDQASEQAIMYNKLRKLKRAKKKT